MKKLLCFLIIALFLFPLTASARREPDNIGTPKAVGNPTILGTQIRRGDAKIWSVNFVANGDGVKGAWLTLYDEYSHPLRKANVIMEIEIATAGNSEIVPLPKYPIDTSNGLYAVGENGTYIILYE